MDLFACATCLLKGLEKMHYFRNNLKLRMKMNHNHSSSFPILSSEEAQMQAAIEKGILLPDFPIYRCGAQSSRETSVSTDKSGSSETVSAERSTS